MATFINISERYGEAELVTLADYRELNPDGIFEEKPDQIIEQTGTGFEVIAVKAPETYRLPGVSSSRIPPL
jgi:hypothetical protein